MKHVKWEGFHHHDTIFALFLFISGMTFPFSSAKKLEKGMSKGNLTKDVLKRACILFFLGGVAGLVPEALGVVILKISYFAAAWLMLYFMYKKNVFLKV